MFDPRRGLATGTISLLLALAGPIRAQSADYYRQLLARLRPVIAAERGPNGSRSRDEEHEREFAKARQAMTDTVRVGGLIVITSPEFDRLARYAAARAWDTLRVLLGPAAFRLAHFPMAVAVFEADSREVRHLQRAKSADSLRMLRLLFAPFTYASNVNGRTAPTDVSPVTLGDSMSTGLWRRLWETSTDPVTRWLEYDRLRPMEFDDAAWRDAHRDLVVNGWRTVERCYQGDMTWCREALGLAGGPDQSFRWATPSERRFLVMRDQDARRGKFGLGLYTGCVQQEVPAACDSILRRFKGRSSGAWHFSGEVDAPLDRSARLTLLETAIQLGGAQAIERILSSEDSLPMNALAAAAGRTPDALLSAWHQRVLEARPRGLALGAPFAGLLWCTFFAVVGLLLRGWR